MPNNATWFRRHHGDAWNGSDRHPTCIRVFESESGFGNHIGKALRLGPNRLSNRRRELLLEEKADAAGIDYQPDVPNE